MQYLREKRRIIITFLVFAAVFAVNFYLYHLPILAVLYPTALCLFFGVIIAAFTCVSDYKKHKMLIELKDRSDVAIRSQVESYLSMADNDYRNIIDHICDEKRYRAADDEDVRRYDRLLHDMGASDKNAHSVNAPTSEAGGHLAFAQAKLRLAAY